MFVIVLTIKSFCIFLDLEKLRKLSRHYVKLFFTATFIYNVFIDYVTIEYALF